MSFGFQYPPFLSIDAGFKRVYINSSGLSRIQVYVVRVLSQLLYVFRVNIIQLTVVRDNVVRHNAGVI